MPRTYEVLYNLGVSLYNLDRNTEAARVLAEAADINPAPSETHFRLGLIASAGSDHANAVEQGRHAEPVVEVTGEPVEQDDRPALTGIGVSEPLRAAILRQRNRYVPTGPSRARRVPPHGLRFPKWTTR